MAGHISNNLNRWVLAKGKMWLLEALWIPRSPSPNKSHFSCPLHVGECFYQFCFLYHCFSAVLLLTPTPFSRLMLLIGLKTMTSALRISLGPEIICPDICWLHWLLPNCHQMIADGFQDYIPRDLNVWLKTHFLSSCGSRNCMSSCGRNMLYVC